MKKYITVIESNDNMDTMVFDTIEKANAAGKGEWNHLTKREQNATHIYTASLTENDLYDDAFEEDEEGNVTIDWTFWKDCHSEEKGCVDSNDWIEHEYSVQILIDGEVVDESVTDAVNAKEAVEWAKEGGYGTLACYPDTIFTRFNTDKLTIRVSSDKDNLEVFCWAHRLY